ncbi:MAG TPA: 16S rRNA (guanine(527)-N(7))-methyltransferase RsmG, partial [Wenzhouxiangella sp.]|nr:16S rRNA (guanine(527)-N(7))-methyltransferase RsmG [Wenzhouxiangella sp.]
MARCLTAMVEDGNTLPETLEVQRGRLKSAMDGLGLAATRDQEDQMLHYLALMLRWNRSYNLTAVTEPAEMVARHLIDSLSVLPHLQGGRFVDAGTGPGLPGVPLAIVCPQRRFALLDSNGKKIRFLNQVRRQLPLENIEPIQARLEDYFPDDLPDAIVARALAPLARLVDWASPMLNQGVPLLAMKGQ